MTKTENKTENINLRVSPETKKTLLRIADAHAMSLSEFIITMISEGAALEQQRRQRLRANMQDFINKI